MTKTLGNIVIWIVYPALIWGLIMGCAGVGKFTPTGAAKATNAVAIAQGLLYSLDLFYGDLVQLKLAPDYRVEATRALTLADVAAAGLRAVIAGATVDDAQLNLLAGQVDGAKAILGAVR